MYVCARYPNIYFNPIHVVVIYFSDVGVQLKALTLSNDIVHMSQIFMDSSLINIIIISLFHHSLPHGSDSWSMMAMMILL